MAKFDTVVKELTKLRAVTRPRSQTETDTKLQLAAFAHGLADIDDGLLSARCAVWALENQWFPTLAELRADCISHQPKPEAPRQTYLPPEREIPRNERLRNAWGFGEIQRLMKTGAPQEEWDRLKSDMIRMRAEDSLPPEVRDAID